MEAITLTVEKFYERVLADPNLVPFFARTNLNWLRKRQVQFFAQALGGPAEYPGRDMKTAHEHLAIRQNHFDRVADHLAKTLQSLGTSPPLIEEVIARVALLQAEIVNTPSPPQENG